MERRARIKRSRLLLLISVLLVLVAATLFVVDFAAAGHTMALSVDDIKTMSSVSGSYRSINNWKTVQTTSFEGAPVRSVLANAGVTEGNATVKIMAPDGYFWPAAGDKLTVEELKRKNGEGLLPIIAYKMNGRTLDPDPDGTGPLRYVAPQYSKDETNKPSWVSNVRVIQVGPVPKGLKAPDAKKVPAEEIWVFGNIPSVYPFSMFIPWAIAAVGLALLILALAIAYRKKRGSKGTGPTVAAILVCMLIAGTLLGLGTSGRTEAATSITFSMSDLKSMPAFSGHYTFLKQLPPYTYYEADYTGVALSYLVGQKLNLDAGASGVVVKATDGYTVNLSLAQVNNTYPNGLKIIIAYAKGGSSLVGDEGPLRLIVPQSKPGNHDQGSDPNTPQCARMVNSIEVTPAGGVSAPGSIPSGSLAVYGSVTVPAPVNPTPAPQPQNQVETNTSSQSQAQQAAQAAAVAQAQSNPALDIVSRTFGGARGLAIWLSGAWLPYVLPGPPGLVLWFAYTRAGS